MPFLNGPIVFGHAEHGGAGGGIADDSTDQGADPRTDARDNASEGRAGRRSGCPCGEGCDGRAGAFVEGLLKAGGLLLPPKTGDGLLQLVHAFDDSGPDSALILARRISPGKPPDHPSGGVNGIGKTSAKR